MIQIQTVISINDQTGAMVVQINKLEREDANPLEKQWAFSLGKMVEDCIRQMGHNQKLKVNEVAPKPGGKIARLN